MTNVLVLNLDNDGVGYWRMLSPHLSINDPDVSVDVRNIVDHTLPLLDENFIRNYQVIVYNKKIQFNTPEMASWFDHIVKKNGVKLVYDVDDYWKLDSSHVNYKTWVQNNGEESTISEIKKADYIITTTPIFAKKIAEYNKNIIILPNAVNLNEQQWISNKVESDKTRFIWGGGITHKPDLSLLSASFKNFDKQFLAKSQLYLCGFDLRMKTQTGIIRADWKSNPWSFFEDIFTNNFKYITDPRYNTWLREYTDGGKDLYGVNPEFTDQFYQRRWTKSILLYGSMYNEADVALAPLTSRFPFNENKSQLKLVEAGAHKCPIIASNFGPYTIDDISGKHDNKPKGFVIDENDNSGWYNTMKWFVENPSAVEDYGNNLYEYVKENYSIEVVNRERVDFYKTISKK